MLQLHGLDGVAGRFGGFLCQFPGHGFQDEPLAPIDQGAERVGAGILEELPNVSPKTFYAPKVFSVAYEDVD